MKQSFKKVKLKDVMYPVGGQLLHACISENRSFRRKPAIILVHGIISGKYMSPVGEYLASKFNVYNIDLPGFGDSTKPKETYTIDQHAAVIAEFINRLHLKKPVLLGNSYGCQVIIRFAANYPGMLSKAVLAGPTVDQYARNIFSQIRAYLQDTRYEPAWQGKVAFYEYLKAGLGRIIVTIQESLRDRPERFLKKISVPVLVVRGGKDPFVSRKWSKKLIRLLPHGSYKEITGKGHTVNSNSPRRLATLVTDFIAH